MKKLVLLFLGFLPLPFGFLLNYILMSNVDMQSSMLFNIFSLVILVLWILLGYLTCKLGGSSFKSLAIIHIPALCVLLLLLFQELVQHSYWFNIFGTVTQFFYLPFLNIAFDITFWSGAMWVSYIMAFGIMLTMYAVGSKIREIKRVK